LPKQDIRKEKDKLKKLLVLTLGIVMVLVFTLTVPVMAAKPTVPNGSHIDVNFITGDVTDPSTEIKIFEEGTSLVYFSAGDCFAIIDCDATDGSPAEIQVEEGYGYYVYLQVRGKPDSDLGIRLNGQPVWPMYYSFAITEQGWWVEDPEDYWTPYNPLEIDNLGMTNIATRLFPVLID